MVKPMQSRRRVPAALLCSLIGLALLTVAGRASSRPAATERVPVTFSGGHGTDPRDHGRPVILIASALGVPPGTFRQAFSGVHPAPPGVQPTPSEQRANKAVLLGALAKYGVTNERLDEVSDYYRYQRSLGQMWPTTNSSAYAIVRNGRIARYVVTSGGSGYTSEPLALVPGFPGAHPLVHLAYSKVFSRNGRITGITRDTSSDVVRSAAVGDPPPPPSPAAPLGLHAAH